MPHIVPQHYAAEAALISPYGPSASGAQLCGSIALVWLIVPGGVVGCHDPKQALAKWHKPVVVTGTACHAGLP